MSIQTASPEARKQGESFSAQAKELRQKLNKARERVEKVRSDYAADNASAAEVAEAHNQRDRVQAQLEDVEAGRRSLLGQLAGGHAGYGGESFLGDPNVVATLEQLGHSSSPIGSVMLGHLASREDLMARMRGGVIDPAMQAADSVGGTVDVGFGSRQGPWYGMVPQLRRRLQVLAAIPTQTMDSASFVYTQETGSFDFAQETVELAVKPAGAVGFADASVIARTIPAWVKVPRQQLADVPQLLQSLENRLMYSVMRRIENQILSGDGVGQNLRGILNTTGIANIAFAAGTPLSDLALDAITTVLVSDAVPDLAIFNPLDLAVMLKTKTSGSGDRLDSEGAFAPTANTIWDLPRVASTSMPRGIALVGDFALGATLFIRDAVSVRISDSDQDDFVKNRSTLLGEARVGLAVWNPTAFCEVHLA